MPKRSNLFQRLVLHLHRSLEPEWKVVESAFLRDLITNLPREVDIVASRIVANSEVTLSIECRDQGRPADVEWVESSSRKHEHLATSKLVLWSRSGFSKAAIAKARVLKIDTISQSDATTHPWAAVARKLIGGSIKLVSPQFKVFVDYFLPCGDLRRAEEVADWQFFNEAGDIAGSVKDLLQFVMSDPNSRRIFLEHAPLGKGQFYLEVVPPVPWFTPLPSLAVCRISRIGIGVKTESECAALESVSAVFSSKVVTLAEGSVANGTVSVLIEEGETLQSVLPGALTLYRNK